MTTPVTVHPGANTLYVYNRDEHSDLTGVIFHARFDVTPPIASETIRLISGQRMKPGPPVQLIVGQGQPDVGFASGPLVAGSFALANAAVTGGPGAFIVQSYPAWIPNGFSSWINANIGLNNYGNPPVSGLYSIRFDVAELVPTAATLQLCWSVDDTTGTQGIYVNGAPVLNAGAPSGVTATPGRPASDRFRSP